MAFLSLGDQTSDQRGSRANCESRASKSIGVAGISRDIDVCFKYLRSSGSIEEKLRFCVHADLGRWFKDSRMTQVNDCRDTDLD
jgi:hypothetical protein